MSDTITLAIKPAPQGGFVVIDVKGVLVPAGEELGGAPSKIEAGQLADDIRDAFKTGEGR